MYKINIGIACYIHYSFIKTAIKTRNIQNIESFKQGSNIKIKVENIHIYIYS